MKLTKCEQGHFYDGDKYPACPYCNTDLQSESAIVHTSAAAEAAEAAPPEGPVTGWLVVTAGPGRGLRYVDANGDGICDNAGQYCRY